MSHWEYYGEDQHRPDIKLILKDILSNTDGVTYQRFNLILSEIERLEEEAKVAEEVEVLKEELVTLELAFQESNEKLVRIQNILTDLVKEFKE